MKFIGFEKVPTKGAVTKFRKRMDTDFNRFFGNSRFLRMSKEMESQKFTRFDKKIRRTATKWAGFSLMLYVFYGLGFVNILEDMKVEKRSNCVYTPLQIRLSMDENPRICNRRDLSW